MWGLQCQTLSKVEVTGLGLTFFIFKCSLLVYVNYI